MLVLVDQGYQLHHGRAPDVIHLVLDQVQQNLVQILCEQIPHYLVLIRAFLFWVLVAFRSICLEM